MSIGVLSLVLAAAFAHAGWNFLAKGAEGGAAFVWLCAAVGTLLYVPVLAIALGTDPGALGWAALGLMVGCGALHAVYFVLLQRGYAAGDLSLVYPLARGTGPLLAGTAAIALPRRAAERARTRRRADHRRRGVLAGRAGAARARRSASRC